MNACRPHRELLSALLDGALAPAERERLQAHLDQCPACREALDELRRTLDLIKGLEPVSPPPWLAERILERVRDAPRPPTALQRLLTLAARPPLQAASLLLVCLAGYLALRVSGPRNIVAEPGPPPAAQAVQESFRPPPPARPRSARRAEPSPPPAADAAPAPEAKVGTQHPAARSEAGQDMAGKAAGAAWAPAPLAYRLGPRDPEGAGARVEAALRGAGATILAPPGRRSLSARVPAAALPALLRQLEALGSLAGPRPGPADISGEDVVVALTW